MTSRWKPHHCSKDTKASLKSETNWWHYISQKRTSLCSKDTMIQCWRPVMSDRYWKQKYDVTLLHRNRDPVLLYRLSDARKVPKVGTRNRITSWRRDVTLLQANDDRLSLTNDVMKILHLERSGWDYFTEAVTSHSFKELGLVDPGCQTSTETTSR